MNTKSVKTQQDRYPGSRPFEDTADDRRVFFGRDDDITAIRHALNSGRLTVLYARSGMGKTSLVNAALMPQLRDQDCLPLNIRLNSLSDAALSANVMDQVEEQIAKSSLDTTTGDRTSLWHFFKSVEIWSSDDALLLPVLVFDQFEELFTLQSHERRAEFIDQLSDLVSGMPPRTVDGDRREVVRTFGDSPPNVKILIAMREDFLGLLEELAEEIPGVFRNRYRLKGLTREQAAKAITLPASAEGEGFGTPPFTFSRDAIDTILDHLCRHFERNRAFIADEMEPFELQILCSYIEFRVRRHEIRGAVDRRDIGSDKQIVSVFRNYYRSKITRIPPHKRGHCLRLFEKGFISRYTKRRLSLELGEIEHRFKVKEKLLEELVNQRLVRKENRVGSVYYELSHDSLIKPVLSNRIRRTVTGWVKRIAAFTGIVFLCVAVNGLIKFDKRNNASRGRIVQLDAEVRHLYKRLERMKRNASEGRDMEIPQRVPAGIEKFAGYRRGRGMVSAVADTSFRGRGAFARRLENDSADVFQAGFEKRWLRSSDTYSEAKITDSIAAKLVEIAAEYMVVGIADSAIDLCDSAAALDSAKAADRYSDCIGLLLKKNEVRNALQLYRLTEAGDRDRLRTYERIMAAVSFDENVRERVALTASRFDGAGDEFYRKVAEYFFSIGDVNRATEVFGKTVAVEAELPIALTVYARTVKDLVVRKRMLHTVLRHRALFVPAMCALANTFKDEGLYDSALAYCESAEKAHDGISPEVFLVQGEIYEKKGDRESAEKAFRKAIPKNADDSVAAMAFQHLGVCYDSTDSAIDFYRRSLALLPGSSRTRYLTGNWFVNRGMPDSALYYWKSALAADAGNAAAAGALGWYYANQGADMRDTAWHYYTLAVSIDGRDADALMNMGYLLLQDKKYDDAIGYLTQAADLSEETRKTMFEDGGVKFEIAKDYREAWSLFTALMKSKYHDLPTQLNYAEACIAVGSWYEAWYQASDALGSFVCNCEDSIVAHYIAAVASLLDDNDSKAASSIDAVLSSGCSGQNSWLFNGISGYLRSESRAGKPKIRLSQAVVAVIDGKVTPGIISENRVLLKKFVETHTVRVLNGR